MEGYDASEKYMLTQCMVWYIQRDHIGDGGWRQYVSGIDMSVKEQKAFMLSVVVLVIIPDITLCNLMGCRHYLRETQKRRQIKHHSRQYGPLLIIIIIIYHITYSWR